MKKTYIWIYTTVVVLLIDFFSKYLILHHFYLHETKMICCFFNIYYTRNYGAAFSLLSNYKIWPRWLLSSISIIVVCTIIQIIIISPKNHKYIIPYALIIGGAIGNLIDRIYYGFVIDFIDFHIKFYHFCTFNIADLSIFTGVVLIILYKLLTTKK